MKRRQTQLPQQWLIADERSGSERELLRAVRRLRPGTGVLLLHHGLPPARRERLLRSLRRIALSRELVVLDEARGSAARVHDHRELARAQLRGAGLLLLSPMFPTRSHPERQPLPRMRAAALIRLASRPVLALGGMDGKGFARVRALGFHGWAGIDAWIRT